MNFSNFKRFLAVNGVPRTEAVGGEFVLTRQDAIEALKLLSDTDVGILGGDVYELEGDGYFRSTYDNWYCNRADSSEEHFAKESREVALDYVINYREPEGADIRYVLVIDDRQ